METTRMADARCGMSRQIHTLLKVLSEEEIEEPTGMWIATVPFTNCREMGFVISVGMPAGIERRNYCFYEHRNSDQIILQKWEGRIPICWGVRAEDIPDWESKWDYEKCWNYMDFVGVLDYMRGQFRELALICKSVAV